MPFAVEPNSRPSSLKPTPQELLLVLRRNSSLEPSPLARLSFVANLAHPSPWVPGGALSQPAVARQLDVAALFDALTRNVELVIQGKTEQIRLALVNKAKRLNVPEEELGPAAGMLRYPGLPGDFSV